MIIDPREYAVKLFDHALWYCELYEDVSYARLKVEFQSACFEAMEFPGIGKSYMQQVAAYLPELILEHKRQKEAA